VWYLARVENPCLCCPETRPPDPELVTRAARLYGVYSQALANYLVPVPWSELPTHMVRAGLDVAQDAPRPPERHCPVCNGSGEIVAYMGSQFDFDTTTCSICAGSGLVR
jgi:hypothetical protein